MYAKASSIFPAVLYSFIVNSASLSQSGYDYVDAYSELSANIPYLTVTYASKSFTLTGLFPQIGAMIPRTTTNRFGWSIVVPADTDGNILYGTLVQKSGTFQWRVQGDSTINTLQIGTNNYLDVPANTFTSRYIEWRVLITSNGNYTATSSWTLIDTDDATSKAVTVSPASKVVEDTNGITYTWRHVIDSGTAQTGYQIATSIDQGSSWTTLLEGSGSTQSAKAAHNATPSGAILWRVRTKNSVGAYGSWSAGVGIVVRTAPDAPKITYVDTKPRPTVKWSAVNQQAYRVTVGDYDTGFIYGTAKSFKMPDYLDDGTYLISVTIQNTAGLVSDPTTISTMVKNISGETFTLISRSINNSINLSWGSLQSAIKHYVMRDGKPIAQTSVTAYKDFLCCGPHTYQIMSIDSSDYYTKSNELTDISFPLYAMIGPVDSEDFLLLKWTTSDGPDKFSQQNETSVEFVQYDGREYPVAYVSNFKSQQNTLSYKFLDKNSFDKLKSLNGKTVIYKNFRGAKIIGTLHNISSENGRQDNASFTITKTDFSEVIHYS